MEQEKATRDEHHLSPSNQIEGYSSNVDSSRPFSSVKEAVAIFAQRIHLPGHTQTLNPKPKSPIPSPSLSQGASSSSMAIFDQRIHLPGHTQTLNPKPRSPTASPSLSLSASSSSSPWKQPSLPCSPSNPREEEFMDVLKKLEAEIKETKTELKILKQRESETEVALATLNAELHKNMSKIAKAEAEAAGKSAAAMAITAGFETTKERSHEREISVAVGREEDRRKELMRRMEREYPTLAQILDGNKGNRQLYYGKKEKKMKKKPIVPLVGDFFFKKRGLSGGISAPISSTLHFS